MRFDPGLDDMTCEAHATIDARIEALAAASASDELVESEVIDITRALGFDSFSYALSPFDAPFHAGRNCASMWTTLPRDWVIHYQRMGYAEIDPRLTHTRNRTTHYLWDAARSSTDWQVQQFLRDAAQFGIRSGVVVSFCDAQHARIVVALNSHESPVGAQRHARVQHCLGEVMLLAMSFHDLFIARLESSCRSSRLTRARLSPRERQCLQMAARGLTSADIGTKLGITERTANFHFSNVISKLGVLNRHEAIARAVSTGMISLGAND